MYSPNTNMTRCGCEIGPGGWLRFIEKKFGKDYLTEEQKTLLLTEGVQALIDALPEDPAQ